MSTNRPTNHTVTHEMVYIDQMKRHPARGCQRVEGTSLRRAAEMSDHFNEDAEGSYIVSRQNDGTLYVIDGDHRREARIALGSNGPVHAIVHSGLTPAQEAALFNLSNTFKQPSYISRMLARVATGEAVATDVVRIIESHGWAISHNSENGKFAAVAAAERVYGNAAGALPRGEYPDVLDRVMATITGAWRHDREAAHQMVVLGIGQVYGRFGDAVDISAFTAKLSQERPNNLIGLARGLQSAQGGTTAAALAKVTAGLYNRKRRVNLLPEWVWTR